MSEQQLITYKLVPHEYIIFNAAGDEKGKTFHFKYYPIRDFAETNAIIYLEENNQSTALIEDVDYLLDIEESAIVLLRDINEGSNVYVTDYEYETLYYRYMYNIRSILGDTDHKTFLYKNKDIIESIRIVFFEIIKHLTSWDIEFNTDLNRIITDIEDYRFTYIAGFTALRLLESKLRRKLNTAIVIRDGPTSIDTSRVVDTFKEEIDSYRKQLEQNLNDELIFGKDSNLILGIVDGIAILAGEINNGSAG